MKHEADDTIARLLRERVEPEPPAGSCLDAEMVAAWFDGALTAAQQREAELHASTCARCQALLATMAEAEPIAAPPRRSVSLVRWLAPALVAATALFVWINVAHRSADIATAPAPEPPMNATAPVATATAPKKSAGRAAPDRPADELRAPSRKTPGTHAEAPPPAVPTNKQDAPAAAAPAPSADRQAMLKDQANAALQRHGLVASSPQVSIVRSPDGSLWRFGSDGVSRSNDNGTTWRDQSLGSSARLLAGSSPSPNVVWFAGAGGIVVVTTDGVSWRWRSLPERVDVTGIAAVDGQTATVTTRDGRRFITHDGGVSWVPASAQENPAAPF